MKCRLLTRFYCSLDRILPLNTSITILGISIFGYAFGQKPAHAFAINDPSFFGPDAITIDFETFPDSTDLIRSRTPLTEQYRDLGVLFSSEDSPGEFQTTDPEDIAGRFDDPLLILGSVGGGGSPTSGNRYASGTSFLNFNVSDIRVDFTDPVDAFGLNVIDNDFTDARITAFDEDGNLLESLFVPEVSEGGVSYQGIRANDISYFILDESGGGVLDSTFIDDLTFVHDLPNDITVPEPPFTIGLLVLAGSGFVKLRSHPKKGCGE